MLGIDSSPIRCYMTGLLRYLLSSLAVVLEVEVAEAEEEEEVHANTVHRLYKAACLLRPARADVEASTPLFTVNIRYDITEYYPPCVPLLPALDVLPDAGPISADVRNRFGSLSPREPPL